MVETSYKIGETKTYTDLNLRFLLKLHEMRYVSLGKVLNERPATVGAWARGQNPMSLDTVIKICSYFNVPLDDFVLRKLSVKTSIVVESD